VSEFLGATELAEAGAARLDPVGEAPSVTNPEETAWALPKYFSGCASNFSRHPPQQK
jgi:hypothetical protein